MTQIGERAPVTFGYVGTWSGKKVWLDADKYDDESICLRDILHSLPHVNRYMGGTRHPISTGQHTLAFARAVERAGYDDMHVRWALIHDMPEYVIGDIPRPFKKQMPMIQALDDRILLTLSRRYGLPEQMPDILHAWDQMMCRNEMDLAGNQEIDISLQWWKLLEPVPNVDPADLRQRAPVSVRIELRAMCKKYGIV